MPVPVFVIAGAAIAGAFGACNAVYGGLKIKDAKGKEKTAKAIHQESMEYFEAMGKRANASMDALGLAELETIQGFEGFSDVIELIQNRPQFAELELNDFDLPDFDSDEFKKLFIGAKALLGGLSSAAAGVAGGVAASGATTAIVAAVGTASTGTAISTLSGAAATNAILAALGGGSLAAGGGGMALGTVVLSSAAGGAALLVGGIVVNVMGHKIAKDAEEFEKQIAQEKTNVDEACVLLEEIAAIADAYCRALAIVKQLYDEKLQQLKAIVVGQHKTDWSRFDEEERVLVQNVVLLVGMLYSMCKVNLVIDDDGDGITDRVNTSEVQAQLQKSSELIEAI